MTSLCRHLSAQEIANWVTTADGCVHTDDTTKLSPTSCEFVFTPPTRRNCFTPPMRQNSLVASASVVCIGLNLLFLLLLLLLCRCVGMFCVLHEIIKINCLFYCVIIIIIITVVICCCCAC